MNIKTFEELYMTELQEACSIEAQLSEALPRMIKATSDEGLKKAPEDHSEETRSQLEHVKALLKSHGREKREHRDQSMEKLIGEAERWIGMMDDTGIRDAALIASVQHIEHYEIAV